MNTPPESLFDLLVISLCNATLVTLGLAPDPTTGRREVSQEDAQHNIEILEMLKDKTKGNLSAQETHLLDSILAELRLKFVECRKKP